MPKGLHHFLIQDSSDQTGRKTQKIFDGGGLFLLVSPTGGKNFGVSNIVLGVGEVTGPWCDPNSLVEARRKRDQANALISTG